jgi:hypothetical protein
MPAANRASKESLQIKRGVTRTCLLMDDAGVSTKGNTTFIATVKPHVHGESSRITVVFLLPACGGEEVRSRAIDSRVEERPSAAREGRTRVAEGRMRGRLQAICAHRWVIASQCQRSFFGRPCFG